MKTDINLSKIKDREISVLMGGWSSEREISLKTGEAGSIIRLAEAKKSSVLKITFDPNLG